jgi:surface antigen
MPNIYPVGQCTYGAAEQAPWVMRYGNLGNAKDWANHWHLHGGAVTGTPEVGSVVSFQPSCDSADAEFGHVAYVIAVAPGKFEIREMNAERDGGGFNKFDNAWVGDAACASFLLEGGTPPPPPQFTTRPTPPNRAGLPPYPTPHLEPFVVTVKEPAVNVRYGPGVEFPISAAQLQNGNRLQCDCWSYGTGIPDPLAGHAIDRRWYRFNHYCWVASALVIGNAPNSTP